MRPTSSCASTDWDLHPVVGLWRRPAASEPSLTVSTSTVEIHCADFGLVWNPYFRPHPAPGDWVFATGGAAAAVARRGSSVVVFSESGTEETRAALDEIIQALIGAGCAPQDVAALAGVPALRAAAYATACTAWLFPARERAAELKITLAVPEKGWWRVASSEMYLCANNSTRDAVAPPDAEPPPGDLCAAVASEISLMWTGEKPGCGLAPDSAVCDLSQLYPEIAAEEVTARAQVASAARGGIVVLTGSVGVVMDECVSALAREIGPGVEVFSEADVTRFRAGAPGAAEAMRAAASAPDRTAVVAGANARAGDRAALLRLAAGQPAVVAWVTRPPWWHNSRATDTPLVYADICAPVFQFEPPNERDPGLPPGAVVLRLV